MPLLFFGFSLSLSLSSCSCRSHHIIWCALCVCRRHRTNNNETQSQTVIIFALNRRDPRIDDQFLVNKYTWITHVFVESQRCDASISPNVPMVRRFATLKTIKIRICWKGLMREPPATNEIIFHQSIIRNQKFSPRICWKFLSIRNSKRQRAKTRNACAEQWVISWRSDACHTRDTRHTFEERARTDRIAYILSSFIDSITNYGLMTIHLGELIVVYEESLVIFFCSCDFVAVAVGCAVRRTARNGRENQIDARSGVGRAKSTWAK